MGETWKRQRRIIDPAFEGGRLRDVFPSMCVAGSMALTRLGELADRQVDGQADGQAIEIEIEAQTSHVAADVIFSHLVFPAD